MKHRRKAVFCLAVFAASCGKQMQVVLPPPTPARVGAVEIGIASWYGRPYHGRTTSNGEKYDMNALTAAHLSLPFDTMVRVTNEGNGRMVEVRINDRGPFLKNRVIDVSRAAAQRLDMIALGTAKVRVEVIATPAMTAAGAGWTPVAAPAAALPASCGGPGVGVQVGSFRDAQNASRTLARVAEKYTRARIVAAISANGTLHRVVVEATDNQDAERTLRQLQQDGIEGFVTQFEPDSGCLVSDAS